MFLDQLKLLSDSYFLRRVPFKTLKGVHYQNIFPFFLNYGTILLICCYAQSPDKKNLLLQNYVVMVTESTPHSEIDTILCAGLLDRH